MWCKFGHVSSKHMVERNPRSPPSGRIACRSTPWNVGKVWYRDLSRAMTGTILSYFHPNPMNGLLRLYVQCQNLKPLVHRCLESGGRTPLRLH